MPLPTDIDAAFPFELVRAARMLNTNPLELAEVLYSESEIRSSVINSIGCAGINQFCPSIAAGLPGWPGRDAYVRLPPSVQLRDFVAPWWLRLKNQHSIDKLSGRDLYWLNFLPGLYRANVSSDYVITRDPGYVAANPGFSQGKGYITAGDLERALKAGTYAHPARWASIANAIQVIGPQYAGSSRAKTVAFVVGSVALGTGIWYLSSLGKRRK